MWVWYIAWAWMGVMVWMILFDHIRPNRPERSIEVEQASEWAVPRKAMCRIGQCGRCQNCHADRWAEVWRSLLPEDKQWVIDQHTYVGMTEWDARPSLTRWMLR